MRLGQKMDNGQTDRDSFVPWPAHCSHAVLYLTICKYIEETKPALHYSSRFRLGHNQNRATHESFGPKGPSVVKAIAELPPDWRPFHG
jgi:hypothetical protein